MANERFRTVYANGKDEESVIFEMKQRAQDANTEISAAALKIINDVKQNGFSAVLKYSLKFDRKEPCEITAEEIDEAYQRCDKDLICALEKAAENIKTYHERMLCRSWGFEREAGAYTGQIVSPLEKVGIYVPGGTAAYPSSVLMNAIPAKVAGVREIIMVTPPGEHLKDAVLAAAKIAGIDRVIAVGGVQAIAALTFGAGFIPAVDKIAGPGNAYVAAAKRLVFGTVDIDMIAGPSEVLVVADETADPVYVAADLLSQAEHDESASAILLTTSAGLANVVSEEIEKQCAVLKRRPIIEKSLSAFGAAIVCEDLTKAAALANLIAPEHLEIMTADPRALLPEIKNAGAVFLGAYSPEPLGDYMAGPSHVLPTSGTARFFSPLSTDSFLKKTSVIEYTKNQLLSVSKKIERLAQEEGLDAHKNAITVRRA